MSDLLTQTIQIRIEAFGAIERLLPADFSIACQADSWISDVLQQVARNFPEAEVMLERCACAIGEDIVPRQTQLKADTHLALLSPVAGG